MSRQARTILILLVLVTWGGTALAYPINYITAGIDWQEGTYPWYEVFWWASTDWDTAHGTPDASDGDYIQTSLRLYANGVLTLDDAKKEYGVTSQTVSGNKWDNRRTGILWRLSTTHKAVDIEPGNPYSPFTDIYYSGDQCYGP